ncbi:MAG: uncharacterized membrane protein (UPF0127 family) [Hyphomicrobiaceae bacterium]|jgi:uncharacterized membrane protein (UPF0127 family)
MKFAISGDRSNRARLWRALFFCVGWLFLSTLQATSVFAEMRKDPLTAVTASGRHDFIVEITETDADKAMGLMFRQTMPRRSGMLFAYDKPFEITMWMRNTYISLDMIFILKDGRVHRIAKGTEPFSERVVASQGDVSAVLEVAAGVADEIGLKAGDKIEHSFFGKK